MTEVREQYDYGALNRRINRRYDFFEFTDLRGISGLKSVYSKSKSPTENIQDFLLKQIYSGDAKKAKHHAFDVYHAIHEQALLRGYAHGFNDFALEVRDRTASMEIHEGKIRFLDADGKPVGEFEASSSLRTDLRERRIERRTEVKEETKLSLRELLPGFEHQSLRVPDYHPNNFRLSTDMLKNFGEPFELISDNAKETVCAAYATEVLRYYMGSKFVRDMKIEGKDAWELKRTLLNRNGASVASSMNQFFETASGRPVLSFVVKLPNGKFIRVRGQKAKETPYYGSLFRKFYRAAASSNYPPSLITLYYHGTHFNQTIVEANRERGAESLNSHVTVNLGEGRKYLNLGVFQSPSRPKSVREVVLANFNYAHPGLHWMFLDGKADPKERRSRVYLNGEQLFYRNGNFSRRDGSEAMVYQNDHLEWEDVMVADRFYDKNRLVGLTELMLTGRYDLVDVLRLNPSIVPEERRNPPPQPPYRVAEIFYLKPGQTIDDVLREKGVTEEELPYHHYAYERAGLDARKIRPLDPIPFFELSDVAQEVSRKGGLASAAAKVRKDHAHEFHKQNPDSFIFVIQPNQSPQALMEDIFNLPAIRRLGKLSGKEKQFIITALVAANRDFSVEANEDGKILSVQRFQAGNAIYFDADFLKAVGDHIRELRRAALVFIPAKLPGGKSLKEASFTSAERLLIENATMDPNARKALALILSMEQKQEGSGLTPFVSRKGAKRVLEWLGVKNRSLGLFQVRVLPGDTQKFGLKPEELRQKLLDDPSFNAEVAALRVSEIIPRVERLYRLNGETFDMNNSRCMAFVLNAYHSSEGKVLSNVFSVWADLVEERLSGKLSEEDERKPTAPSVQQRFARIGHFLIIHRDIPDLTEAQVNADSRLVLQNKSAFLQSKLFKGIQAWYKTKTGEAFSLSIDPRITDRKDIATTFLNYGTRATRYGAIDAIEQYSAELRHKPKEAVIAQT